MHSLRCFFIGAVGASPSASAVTADAFHTANLPLWSQFCCRLAAMPLSVDSEDTEGVLFLQVLNVLLHRGGRGVVGKRSVFAF